MAAMLFTLSIMMALVPLAPILCLLLITMLILGTAESGLDVEANTLLGWVERWTIHERAIFAHLTRLGFTIQAVDDRGEMFGLAITIFLGSLVILYLRRREIPIVGSRLFSQVT